MKDTVKERPILFSGPMVRALLAGTKTQTRRTVKPGAGQRDWLMTEFIQYLASPRIAIIEGEAHACFDHPKGGPGTCIKCPYGQPGDRLWVRETFRVAAWREQEAKLCVDYAATPEVNRTPWIFFDAEAFSKYHRESVEQLTAKGIQPDANGVYAWPRGQAPTKWRPSIFMPRAASRLLLEITAVRVERLQAISELDAVAEGIEQTEDWGNGWTWYQDYLSEDNQLQARESYASLWRKINGPESWDANRWVWVVEFKVISPAATIQEGKNQPG